MPLTNQSTRFCQKYSITAMTLVTIITLTGCATTKIGSRVTARAIIDQRVSVLSGSRLSSDTKSRLVQAGLDEEKCLANMPACVVTLKQADLNTDKGIYGAMLAEGGGFKEGTKYLEKAEKMGYLEATQSLAQADLLDDKKDRAIQRLTEFKAKNPDNPYIDEQLRIVNSGKYYIWDIPAKVVQ